MSALAALRTSPGDGHLYAVARDGGVWTSSWRDRGRPGGWSPLGAPLFPPGAEVVVLCNRLEDRDLFVLGRDGRLWNTCWVTDKPWKQWRRWEALGRRRFPAGAGMAAATVANAGDVAAFAVDGGGRLWIVRFPDPERGRQQWWSGFSAIDGPPLGAGAPVCAISSGHGGDLAVLALARDGRVWTAATTWPVPAPPARWGQWSALGALRAVSIRALRDADGTSAVVAVGEDGRLHAASAPAGETWGSWSALGRRRPALDAGIVVMAGARGERRVLVLGSDGRVWTNVARGGAWGGWAAVGARRFAGARASPRSAIVRASIGRSCSTSTGACGPTSRGPLTRAGTAGPCSGRARSRCERALRATPAQTPARVASQVRFGRRRAPLLGGRSDNEASLPRLCEEQQPGEGKGRVLVLAQSGSLRGGVEEGIAHSGRRAHPLR